MKKWLVSLLCASVGVASLGLALTNVSAGAEEGVSVTTIAMEMTDAAEIRVNDPIGIRFQTTYTITPADDTVNVDAFLADYTFGTLVIPSNLLEGELTLETAKVVDIPQKVWATGSDDTTKIMNSVLAGIPDEADYYKRDITARSYYTVGGVTTYAETFVERNIAEVAAAALNDGKTDAIYDKYVNAIATGVEIEAENFGMGVGGVETLTATTAPAGYSVVWSSDNESVATVNKNGEITAKASGTANITATFGNYSDTITVTVDGDTANKVTYYPNWGGSTSTAGISVNKNAEGLCGAVSTQSILIEDYDVTGYNDYMWQMGGYTGFSADVKIVLSENVSSAIGNAVRITDEGGNLLNAVEVNTWSKIYSAHGNWGFMFTFPTLTSSDSNKISAKIYLDNVKFYTAATIGEIGTWRIANPTGAVTQIANGDTSLSEWKGDYNVSIPNISVSGSETTHHNHAIVIKSNISDISNFNGITFAVKAKTWNRNNNHYFYLVPQSKVNGLTADTMDSFGQIQTSYANHGLVRVAEPYEARNPGAESGWQIIHITKAELTAAGYDITNLDTIVFAFRNAIYNLDSSIGSTGWAGIGAISFCDFKVY